MEHFQIYLTRRAQQYFGIASKDVRPDKETEVTETWHRLWRIDHLTCNADETQHLFLATNAASLYSFIIPLFAEESFERLISLFYQHWFDAVLANGLFPPAKPITKTEYLRGRPASLIGSMNMIVEHALDELLDRGASVKLTHESIRSLPIFRKDRWFAPSEEFTRLLKAAPPYPPFPLGGTMSPLVN
jgi:hypothetical protein